MDIKMAISLKRSNFKGVPIHYKYIANTLIILNSKKPIF